MKLRVLFAALFCSFVALGDSPAQSAGGKKGPAPKTAADVAFDDFEKVRTESGAKPDQARFQKLIGAGIAYISQHAAHGRVPDVVRALGTFGATLREKNQAALRAAYVAQLKYEVVTARYKEGLSDEAKTAFAALDAAAADFEAREAVSGENLNALRGKLDTLTALPGAGRFLVAAERSYVEILTRGLRASAGEAHLRKLLEHEDAGVKAMARDELNLVEVRKQPYALKFTALDGKEVDVAQMRGKVVVLFFWSTSNEASVKAMEPVRVLHGDFRKQGLEVIGVSFDKEADREKVLQFVKDKKLAWPVHFDGKEAKNEWSPKLNIRRVPAVVMFDRKGMLVPTDLRRLENDVKIQLLVK